MPARRGPLARALQIVRLLLRAAGTLAVVLLIALPLGGLGLVWQAHRWPSWQAANPLEQEAIEALMRGMGVAGQRWDTLVISRSQETRLLRAAVWERWARLEEWPAWAGPAVTAARWEGEPGWRPGARFALTRALGPKWAWLSPGQRFDRITAAARVVEAVPGQHVVWESRLPGLRTRTLWLFQDLSGGGTLITLAEAHEGALAGLLKPLLSNRWQSLVTRSLAGLIRATAGTPGTPPAAAGTSGARATAAPAAAAPAAAPPPAPGSR